jgi:UTP--glucose-1-phosphate uridylyltransferase
MKAIIPAAWYGTRMLPITKTIPKEMLPVGNKPVIQYIVEWLVSAGIQDIVMITSQGKAALEDYFDKNYELEELLKRKGKSDLLDAINAPKEMANIVFTKQKTQLGWTHAVAQWQPWMKEWDYFFMTFGDNFFDPTMYQEMMDLHLWTGNPVVCCIQKPAEELSKYGVMMLDGDRIIDMVEKPELGQAPSDWIMAWAAILPYRYFSAVEQTTIETKTGEFDVAALRAIIFAEFETLIYRSSYPMWDVGTRELWLQANIDIMGTQMY